jgi:anti-sigma factor RsiW
MNCNHCSSHLFEFAENSLTGREFEAVSEHIQNCSHCAKLVAEIKSGFAVMKEEKTISADPWLQDKIIARISTREKTGAQVPVLLRAALRLSFVLVIGIATGVGINKLITTPADEVQTSVANTTGVADAEEDLSGSENTILSLNE